MACTIKEEAGLPRLRKDTGSKHPVKQSEIKNAFLS